MQKELENLSAFERDASDTANVEMNFEGKLFSQKLKCISSGSAYGGIKGCRNFCMFAIQPHLKLKVGFFDFLFGSRKKSFS